MTVESADTGTDMHAHALGVCRAYFQTRVGYRLVGGGKGEMDEAPHLALPSCPQNPMD
jgi:hypothetical protein